MSGCPYRYLFGKPGEGAHSYRLGGIAIVDTFLTILVAMATAYYTRTGFLINLAIWFVAGEVLHYLFGTQTALLTMLGVDAESGC